MLFPLLVSLSFGCVKEFLDKKPEKSLVVPKTLADFQALLDNGYNFMNRTSYLTQVSDGDFEIDQSDIHSLDNVEKNSYLWKSDVFEGDVVMDWNLPYRQIFYANVVIEGLENIEIRDVNVQNYNEVKGSALFYRAYALNQLVQQFAATYEPKSAKEILGVPIRTDSDVNIKVKRGTLEGNYNQIISDIKESIPLLPDVSERKTRPSKAAAFALLARVYLIMGEYNLAVEMSTNALSFQGELIDYNELNVSVTFPFSNGRKVYNKEIIYYTDRFLSFFYYLNTVKATSNLFEKYNVNDLRLDLFYNASFGFKGSYSGSALDIFTGLATDELYLIRAECYARTGNIPEAMEDLNTLMKKRWNNSVPYVSFEADNETDALTIILAERRKELVTRGLRWSDLRRLNKDPRFQVTLERSYQGEVYRLLPNDKRYTFPIPQPEIEGSGIEQNER